MGKYTGGLSMTLTWIKINEIAEKKMFGEPVEDISRECLIYIQTKLNHLKKARKIMDWLWFKQFIGMCDTIANMLKIKIPDQQKEKIEEIKKFMEITRNNYAYMQSQL